MLSWSTIINKRNMKQWIFCQFEFMDTLEDALRVLCSRKIKIDMNFCRHTARNKTNWEHSSCFSYVRRRAASKENSLSVCATQLTFPLKTLGSALVSIKTLTTSTCPDSAPQWRAVLPWNQHVQCLATMCEWYNVKKVKVFYMKFSAWKSQNAFLAKWFVLRKEVAFELLWSHSRFNIIVKLTRRFLLWFSWK